MKTYRSKKSLWVGLVIIGSVTLLVGLFIADMVGYIEKGPILIHVFDLLVALFLIWLWVDTKYVISGYELIYKSGTLKGKIDIKNIKKIEYNKYLWSGMRPALSTKGMVVYYNKFDEIFLSPLDRENFVETLLQLNPEIEIIKT